MKKCTLFTAIFFASILCWGNIRPPDEPNALNTYPQPIRLLENISVVGPQLSESLYLYMKSSCGHLDLNNKNISEIVREACQFPIIYQLWKGSLKAMAESDGIRLSTDHLQSIHLKAGLWITDYFLEPDEAGGYELVLKALLLEAALQRSMEYISLVIQKKWAPGKGWQLVTTTLPLVQAYLFNSSQIHSLIQYYTAIRCAFRHAYCEAYKSAVARSTLNVLNVHEKLINQLTQDITGLLELGQSEMLYRNQRSLEIVQTHNKIKNSNIKPTEILNYMTQHNVNSESASATLSVNHKTNILSKLDEQIRDLTQYMIDFTDLKATALFLTTAKIGEIMKVKNLRYRLNVDVEWETEYALSLISSPEYNRLSLAVGEELKSFKKTLKLSLKKEGAR